jgi:Zinc carboxypeptidase
MRGHTKEGGRLTGSRFAALALCLVGLPVWRPLLAQVPSFKEVTGHDFGERITVHDEMVRYLERMADASPRVTVERQGASWEGKEFLMAVVTAPENHARLRQIQANAQRLADPRTTPPDAVASIVSNQPVILWFGGSIHGFELSGSEAALKLLEHLATHDDPETMEVLRDAVVLIDPMLNPDGRDAFAHLNHENIGREPSPAPEDWSNDFTGWQATKFRTGHYYFDNNRDWFATTQPETRQRVQTLLAWRPQAVTDMHEMGPDQEFFFYPAAAPTSPHVPPFALRWIERFATQIARAFDEHGVEYMTREGYDYFYPGYTDGYASYQGAVGMLYEQGSSRGLALRRSDGTIRTLAQAVEHQYTAAWAAVRYGASERATLLREYYDALAAAIAESASGVRRYLITPDGDPSLRADFASLLARAGIDANVLTEPASLRSLRDRTGASIDRRDFPPGTYVVETAQPRARLIRTLLEPNTPLPNDFVQAARARVERGENAELYDVSAWSLPLLFNLQVFASSEPRLAGTDRLAEPGAPAATPIGAPAEYAYLIDGRNARSMVALHRLVTSGYRVGVLTKATRIQGQAVPTGTVVVRVNPGGEEIHTAVRRIAEDLGLSVRSVATGLADSGFHSLGSADVVTVPSRARRIAIVAEDPVQAYSFGWAWYTLDRVYPLSPTVIRARSVSSMRLDHFDVIVLPSASSTALRAALGESGIARVRQWVRDGGTLVTIGQATDFARDDTGLDLISLRSWYDTDAGKNAQRFDVPGSVLRGQLDLNHPLTAGYERSELPVLVNGSRIYLAPDGPPDPDQHVILRYAPRDSLHLSGLVWDESLDRLSGAAVVYAESVGRGRVVAFAEDPNFRGFWRGIDRLFLNAVLLP